LKIGLQREGDEEAAKQALNPGEFPFLDCKCKNNPEDTRATDAIKRSLVKGKIQSMKLRNERDLSLGQLRGRLLGMKICQEGNSNQYETLISLRKRAQLKQNYGVACHGSVTIDKGVVVKGGGRSNKGSEKGKIGNLHTGKKTSSSHPCSEVGESTMNKREKKESLTYAREKREYKTLREKPTEGPFYGVTDPSRLRRKKTIPKDL